MRELLDPLLEQAHQPQRLDVLRQREAPQRQPPAAVMQLERADAGMVVVPQRQIRPQRPGAAFADQPVLGELQPGAREVQPLVQVNLQRGQDVFVRQEREGRGLDGVGANGGGVGLHRDSSRGGRFWPSRIVRPWRR